LQHGSPPCWQVRPWAPGLGPSRHLISNFVGSMGFAWSTRVRYAFRPIMQYERSDDHGRRKGLRHHPREVARSPARIFDPQHAKGAKMSSVTWT
jgi:hypothetical protein